MLQTYELYLHRDREGPVFEALTCSERDLVASLRRLLDARQASSIEVRRRGETLFTLERPARPDGQGCSL